MRRSENTLPSRRDWEGSWYPSSQSGFMSPSSFFASPWQMMRRMQEDMDRVFGQFFGSGQSGVPAQSGGTSGIQQWTPSVDISQDDKEWCIEADLPGVKQDDIDVQVQDHYLILRAELRPGKEQQAQAAPPEGQQKQPHNGQQENQQREYYHRERRWGYFERVLPLPENVDENNVSCDFQNGVLTIHLPKSEEQAQKGRRIPIGAGAASGQAGAAPRSGAAGTPAAAGAKGGETPP